MRKPSKQTKTNDKTHKDCLIFKAIFLSPWKQDSLAEFFPFLEFDKLKSLEYGRNQATVLSLSKEGKTSALEMKGTTSELGVAFFLLFVLFLKLGKQKGVWFFFF